MGVLIIQFLNNEDRRVKSLFNTIGDYYEYFGDRWIDRFESEETERGECYVRYLLGRKHVIEYRIIMSDRMCLLSRVSLAIGPHYFSAASFWDYENYERFTHNVTAEAVIHNLKLMDEFLGYKTPCSGLKCN